MVKNSTFVCVCVCACTVGLECFERCQVSQIVQIFLAGPKPVQSVMFCLFLKSKNRTHVCVFCSATGCKCNPCNTVSDGECT